MTEDQEERLVCAFESIATQLSGIGRTLELDHQRRYPPKKAPREMEVSHVRTEEEKLRESQGQTGERNTQEWTELQEEEIGPRERAFLEDEERRRPKGDAA